MSADMTRLNRNVVAGQRAFDRQLLAMERRAQQMERRLQRTMAQAGQGMVNSLKSSLTSLAPTLAAAFSTQQVIKYADAYTGLQNRLKAAGLEGENLKRVEDALYEAANRNGVAVSATTELYQRATMARQNLGASEADLLALVNGTTAALKLQGTSTTEASGALLQLGQLLGGNKVQAQEYNSLIDGLPVLLEAVAKGSDRWGGSINKLTLDVKAGKVSSQEFFQAALKGFADIETRAGAATLTVGSALQTLDNQLGRFVGQTDSGLSATNRMALAIQALAMNLDKVIPVVVTLAALVGGRFAWSLTASASAIAANGVAAVTSAARLFQFQTAMTMSMTGASRATAMMAGATVTATGAVRGFTAALAANPIGLAIIAITALTAAFASYKSTIDDARAASEKSNKLIREFGVDSKGAISGVNALKDATSGLRTETLALADAYLERARAARLAQITENRIAAQKLREPNLWQRGLEMGLHAVPGVGGTAARAAANARKSAADALDKQSADLMAQAIEIAMAPGATWTHEGARSGGSAGSDPKKKGSGPTPEELAAAREMLRLQAELQLLQAAGNEDQARAVQRQIDLINVTKQFTNAQVTNAAAEAKAQLEKLWVVEDAVRIAEEAERQGKKNAERRERADQAEAEHARQQNDLLLDRLGYEAELARLSGSPSRLETAERELFIAERINELLRLKPGLITEAEARAQATSEYGALENADREGKVREEFRSAFRDGIRAAIDGDMGGFFESLADRFTDRMLDNLADDLFDLLAGAAKGMMGGGGGGGGLLSALASAFAPRATGGPVTAGQSYLVGERRPEVFVPNVNGTVIPSVNAAMGRMNQASASRLQQAVAVRIDVNDDRFNAYVDGRAAPLAAHGTAAGVAFTQDQARNANRRRRQSLI